MTIVGAGGRGVFKRIMRQTERSQATVAGIIDAARELFQDRGFSAVSVDDIAAKAAVAKGAIYHHFTSKTAIFEIVLEQEQARLATRLHERLGASTEPRSAQSIATNVLAYLEEAAGPSLRRLLLVDGPAVLGWARWREIDDRYFLGSIQSGLAAILPRGSSAAQIRSASQLIAGAIMEAALATGAADDPETAAKLHGRTLERMLSGLAGQDEA